MQWHPIFAHLLRCLLQGYYEVLTEVPVGELPRTADLVVVRRVAPAPFVGIWMHLRPWNVLELKGPTDDPGLRDIDLLIEVGLGIERRQNEKREEQGAGRLERGDMAWWYLANHLGRRFRADVETMVGRSLSEVGPGLWQCGVLGRTLWLVSRDVLPVDHEGVPLHLVTQESIDRELAVAREVVSRPELWAVYGAWLACLYPEVWEEVQKMIRSLGMEPTLDLRPLIQLVGLKQVIDQVGLKQVIDQVGLKQVLAEVGPEEIIAAMGVDWFVSHLTPEQAQEVKRRLS